MELISIYAWFIVTKDHSGSSDLSFTVAILNNILDIISIWENSAYSSLWWQKTYICNFWTHVPVRVVFLPFSHAYFWALHQRFVCPLYESAAMTTYPSQQKLKNSSSWSKSSFTFPVTLLWLKKFFNWKRVPLSLAHEQLYNSSYASWEKWKKNKPHFNMWRNIL